MRMKERERDERCGDPETRVIRINAAECFFANTFPLPRFGGIGKLTRCLIYIPEYRTKNRSGGFCHRYHFSSRKRRACSSPLDPSKILGRDYSLVSINAQRRFLNRRSRFPANRRRTSARSYTRSSGKKR